MQDMLRYEGYTTNHRLICRLLRLMDILAIYPRKCLNRCNYAEYIYLNLNPADDGLELYFGIKIISAFITTSVPIRESAG